MTQAMWLAKINNASAKCLGLQRVLHCVIIMSYVIALCWAEKPSTTAFDLTSDIDLLPNSYNLFVIRS